MMVRELDAKSRPRSSKVKYMKMDELDIKTSYGTIHVYRSGKGSQNVLLLHGSGCDNAMLSWSEVMQSFNDDYTVYAPDLLGYGKSDKPADLRGTKFYDIHIDSIKQLTEQLGLERFILAGLSMGGAIAIGYAFKYPAQVQVLIPVDTWGISPTVPFHHLSYWYIYKTDLTITQYKWIAKYRWMAKWFIGYSLIGDKSKITDEIVDEVWKACKVDNAGKSMQDFQRSSCDKNRAIPYYKNELNKLEMPVIFVNGELDSLVPVKHLDGIKEILPDAKIYILKGCKHWSVKEKPDEFFEIVRACTAGRGSGT